MIAFTLIICKNKKKSYTFLSLKEGQIHSGIKERTETNMCSVFVEEFLNFPHINSISS